MVGGWEERLDFGKADGMAGKKVEKLGLARVESSVVSTVASWDVQ